MTKYYLIFIILLQYNFNIFGQQNCDTIIKKIHYNFIDYYPNGKLKVLGNYSDNLKTGQWIYFKQNGKKRACGIYKNGHKNGEWLYYIGSLKPNIQNWDDKYPPDEIIEIDSEGNLNIFDNVRIQSCQHDYKNGNLWRILTFL